MAASPGYAATINNGAAIITTLETDLAVPTQAILILTAGSSGTKIEEIVVEAVATTLVATTVAGLVYLFLYDGSTYHIYDTITVTAITASATTPGFRASKTYNNLVIKSGWKLYASQSETSNDNALKVHAFGADL